ncbi:MAG: hypothetical protein HYX63_22130 [Gammaproteobacteria bacterium]|nr:hypothetical protein [Gammaproteobacteria bacterium]
MKSIDNSGGATDYAYTTDAENRITRIVESVGTTGRTLDYWYDAADRLRSMLSSPPPPARSLYGLDPGDNITGIWSHDASFSVLRRFDINNVNAITSANTLPYTYDANGNRAADDLRTYQWDAENRLVGIGYKTAPTKTTAFRYDGRGRRIAQVETTGAVVTETRNLWCGEEVCQIRDQTDTVTTRFTAEGVTAPYSLIPGLKNLYYSRDQLGSVRNVLAVSTGASLVKFDYDPFGNMNTPDTSLDQLDSDNDTIIDRLDNCISVANPDQRDTDGDGYGNRCDADLDNSGFVNAADLALFRAAFGTSNANADFDGSGFVNFADLAIFTGLFGQSPGPSGPKGQTSSPTLLNFRFAGMIFHSDSGLYLTHYRAYDPRDGRWLSRDPIEEAAGTNLYAYANNNPLSFVDPYGLSPYGYIIKLLKNGTERIGRTLADKADAVAARKAGDSVVTSSRQAARQVEKAATGGGEPVLHHPGHDLPDGRTGMPHYQSDSLPGHSFYDPKQGGGIFPELLIPWPAMPSDIGGCEDGECADTVSRPVCP